MNNETSTPTTTTDSKIPTCECCGYTNHIAGVASCSAPLSILWCEICLAIGAEPDVVFFWAEINPKESETFVHFDKIEDRYFRAAKPLEIRSACDRVWEKRGDVPDTYELPGVRPITAPEWGKTEVQVGTHKREEAITKNVTAPSRCSGQCCREMTIPAVEKVGGLEAFQALTNGDDPAYDSDDHRYIADMLIDLKKDVAVCPLSGVECDSPVRVYGCKHFDAKKGNCMAYDARPNMCRQYPFSKCNVDGCTFSRGEPEKLENEVTGQ